MSKRAPNSARSYDCSAPNAPGEKIASGKIPVDHVKMAVMAALKQRTLPHERCWSLWGFEASQQDAAYMAAVLAEHREAWLPWARLECGGLPGWYWGKE